MNSRDTTRNTRERIREACREMMAEGSAGQINMTALARRAGLHRKTIYLYYDSIDSLFDDLVEEVRQKFTDGILSVPEPYRLQDVLKMFFEVCQGLEKWEERLVCDPGYGRQSEKLLRAVVEFNRRRYTRPGSLPRETVDIIEYFVLSNAISFYRYWAANGRAYPIQGTEAVLYELIRHGAEGFSLPGEETTVTE